MVTTINSNENPVTSVYQDSTFSIRSHHESRSTIMYMLETSYQDSRADIITTTMTQDDALKVSSHCLCKTPKYIIFMAAIPGCVLCCVLLVLVLRVYIKRCCQNGRGCRRRRSRERSSIVRNMGSLHLTSVVNEGNVEGIEMHERYSDFESLFVLILNAYQFLFHKPISVSRADIK